ncbi:TonB-dependent receptor [Rhodoplanes sp. TEM]|uniref:TonB-dependent receptor n=1 Tax=Rhodoplanes tepidamans TaxID=200616 RepID=A0ABT5JCR1_RHOTP|nr:MULTISPECIES: TonB-dependent receptor [Rhodoplanes]MDC7787282.1 TonB-dependent receptor [Rhodoplanes tepidamans]MDC7985310.1 TonB-dependent receptor [Rhodoplanes sp. TEM]MDQ0357817.1 outer membrane receptor protein involved in Fe transport [Rhodoplanes tepidamans]
MLPVVLAVGCSDRAAAQYVDLPALEVVDSEAKARASAPAAAASELTISGEEMRDIPAARVGEMLEVVPGLVVTQHSGEGKANQYFLRGYNLDHGTDLAIWVDGMPVNMRTHGHGQGYADINFLLPELVQSLHVRKGPYYADEGDFSSAGAVHIDYLRDVPKNMVEGTLGMFGYGRGVAVLSTKTDTGATLIAAGEGITYDGPWDVPDRVRKLNGVVRWVDGTADNGFSLTGMAYRNRWTSTDQVAQRAIDQGIISRWGSLDPTDGGEASRYSVSGRWARSDQQGTTRIDAFAINSSLTLYNNFTYFLDDPVNGDQFSQTDRRTVLGVNASHAFKSNLLDRPTVTRVGVQTRYDDIAIGLLKTAQRQYLSTTRADSVTEGSVGLWADHSVQWTDWLRTTVGIRRDWFSGTVDSDTPLNSGDASDAITSPKAGLVLGPWFRTEFFLNAGYGFHSNDIRGATITVDPLDKTTPVDRVPLLVRTRGAEVGMRNKSIDGLTTSVAVFVLDQDSELLFVGDAGTTEASRPSRRVGVEWTNDYRINRWLSVDLDLAYTHARFTDDDPAGASIPGAPAWVGSLAVNLGTETGWFGSLKARYFGPRPLIEDDSVRSLSSFLVNARLGYRFDNGVKVQLDAYNLFNTKTNQIEYYYESRLAGETEAVYDRHVHAVEPLAVRLSLAKSW